jgi:hypothetical protein
VSRTAPRYAREWLEQQAVTGLIEVLDADQEPDAGRYRLRPGVAEAAPSSWCPSHLGSQAPVGNEQDLPPRRDGRDDLGGVRQGAADGPGSLRRTRLSPW